VSYFHIVFTLPHDLSALVLQNKRLLYDLLFRTSAATLLEVARDPKHLGADIGLLSVLHTWGQTLQHHPHVHCVVPAGGLALDGSRWVAASSRFFLPVRVLSRVFRGKFTAELKQLILQDKLQFHRSFKELASRNASSVSSSSSSRRTGSSTPSHRSAEPNTSSTTWPATTHRVAISNHRLVSFKDDRVSFRWKDYAAGSKQKILTVSANEFLRRFLIHVLPKGLVRIRHFGLFANRKRSASLLHCRFLLDAAAPSPQPRPEAKIKCPLCAEPMLVVERITSFQLLAVSTISPPKPRFDSS